VRVPRSGNDGGEEVEDAQKDEEMHRSPHSGSRSVTHSVAREFPVSLRFWPRLARVHPEPVAKFRVARSDVRGYTPVVP
jgi:hypothetical protein